MRNLTLSLLASLASVGCGSVVVRVDSDAGADRVDAPIVPIDISPPPPDRGTIRTDVPIAPRDAPIATPDAPLRPGALDLLLVIDNSNSMLSRQRRLAATVPSLLVALNDPSSSRPITDVHLGIVSTDLGTGGHSIPSCANPDGGDQGRLNPIRNGLAMSTHEPWTTVSSDLRGQHCSNDANQFPTFLSYDSGSFSDLEPNLGCNAVLSTAGCGLEQPLEAAYRALFPTRDDTNQGFSRPDALLAIVVLTDEEDGSTRDCRYAEAGDPDGDCANRGDARDVYVDTSSAWSSRDLNSRFYRYVPGSAQDPTWSVSRYLNPTNAARGFTAARPGHPERVVFGALVGVPREFSRTLAPNDWTTLLGASPDGRDAYIGMSAQGVVSMMPNNPDPDCDARVVPACREPSRSQTPSCDPSEAPFALPARRIAEVARRFDVAYGNGVLGTICADDDGDFVQRLTRVIRRRVGN